MLRDWRALASEVAGESVDRILISSEEFEFLGTRERWQSLRERLPGELRVVCYLRRQDRMLLSEYNQHVKDGGQLALEQFKERVMSRLDYAARLRIVESVCGRESLVVRIYERSQLPNGLFADFFDAVGLDGSTLELPAAPVNPSLSASGLEAAKAINGRVPDEAERRRLVMVELSRSAAESGGEVPLMTADERARLVERFAESNRRVAQRYLGRADGALFDAC